MEQKTQERFEELLRAAVHESTLLPPGASLREGRFEIRRLLGRGGMGVVYEATDRARGENVALKVLPAMGAAAIYRFKREFRALTELEHPNIVKLHELFFDSGVWFFTMELVEGSDFLTYVAEGSDGELVSEADESSPLGGVEARLRDALGQLAVALMFLHEQGKLHRDIKPSNVLVRRDGTVVVLDFGLVAEVRGAPCRTGDAAMGTPAYMAPELVWREELGEASDWYALGVMLYQALTGRLPFRGADVEILVRKQHEEPTHPNSLHREVSEELAELALFLLRRSPASRARGEDVLAVVGGSGARTRGLERVTPPPLEEERFSGRAADLESLASALAATEHGAPVTVMVSGVSGIGKTALVERFLHRVGHRAVSLRGRCHEHESMPFKTCDALVDELSSYLATIPARQAAGFMPRHLHSLVQVFPVLGRLEVVQEVTSRSPIPLKPVEIRRRGFIAFKELLYRIAEQQPLILFIDDLQWSDRDGVGVLESLLVQPDAPRMLLIGAYRSDEVEARSPLAELLQSLHELPDVDVRAVELGALELEECLELVRALMPEGTPRSVRQSIATGSDGNPMFLQTLAHYASVEGEELGESERTFDALLRRQVESLTLEERRLLEVVCLARRQPLPARIAEGALEMSSPLSSLRDELVARRLLVRRGYLSQEALQPFHDQVREVALSAMSAESQRELHLRLAEAFSQRAPEDVEARAAHFDEAGEEALAGEIMVEAAQKARSQLAFGRTARLLERALAIGQFRPERRQELRVLLAEALREDGRCSEAGEAYLAAARCAPETSQHELYRSAAEQMLKCGRFDEGKRLLDRVLRDVGMALPRSRRRAVMSVVAARARIRLRGLGSRTREEASLPLETLRRLDVCWSAAQGFFFSDMALGFYFQSQYLLLALQAGEPRRLARALTWEVTSTAGIGGMKKRDRTALLLDRARELAERMGDPYGIGLVKLVSGVSAAQEFRYAEGVALCDEAVDYLCRHCTGVAYETMSTEIIAVHLLFLLGEVEEAHRRIPELLSTSQATGDRLSESMLSATTFNWLALDDVRTARANLERAREIWRTDTFSYSDYMIMVGQAWIDLYTGDHVDGYRRIKEAWVGFERSLLTYAIVCWLTSVAFRGELAAASSLAQGGDEEALADALDCARKLAKYPKMPAPLSWSYFLRASVAYQRGQRGRAIAFLNRAESLSERANTKIYTATARIRRGAIIGDRRGEALVSSSLEFIRERGAVNPERYADLTVAGFPPL